VYDLSFFFLQGIDTHTRIWSDSLSEDVCAGLARVIPVVESSVGESIAEIPESHLSGHTTSQLTVNHRTAQKIGDRCFHACESEQRTAGDVERGVIREIDRLE